jgi:hypothetical protein
MQHLQHRCSHFDCNNEVLHVVVANCQLAILARRELFAWYPQPPTDWRLWEACQGPVGREAAGSGAGRHVDVLLSA